MNSTLVGNVIVGNCLLMLENIFLLFQSFWSLISHVLNGIDNVNSGEEEETKYGNQTNLYLLSIQL